MVTKRTNCVESIPHVHTKSLSYADIANAQRSTLMNRLDFVEFIAGLQNIMATYHVKVVIRTELRRNNTIFWANTNYRGKIWRDWVIIDWSEEGKLPCIECKTNYQQIM